MVVKPTVTEVIRYATPIIRQFIKKYARDLPHEHKEEIEQEAYVRILEAYENLDPTGGWKSFVYNHSRGTVLDWLKFGKGFQENKWSLRKLETTVSRNRNKLHERVSLVSKDGTAIKIDDVAANNGIFSEIKIPDLEINWNLVARMSFADDAIHAFAKQLRGFEADEIATVLGVTKFRVGQLIQVFLQRFDDPHCAEEQWFLQTCFAFGLCGHLRMPKVDQSDVIGYPLGWNMDPVNLDCRKPLKSFYHYQLPLFQSETA